MYFTTLSPRLGAYLMNEQVKVIVEYVLLPSAVLPQVVSRRSNAAAIASIAGMVHV